MTSYFYKTNQIKLCRVLIKVIFGWRGPLLTEQAAMKDLTACAILLRYLCDTAAAPLQRCLVEREDALAGDVRILIYHNCLVINI